MKNKLSAILILSFILLSLTACSKEKAPAETAPSTSSEAVITEAPAESTAETVTDSEGIKIGEIAYAEIDRFFEEQGLDAWLKDNFFEGDEQASDYIGRSFAVNNSETVVYSAERFAAGVDFELLPLDSDKFLKLHTDARKRPDKGRGWFSVLRYCIIEKKDSKYSVIGFEKEVPYTKYTAEHLSEKFGNGVIMPDRSTADKEEAVQAYRNNFSRPALKFDFGFLRYAKPVFQSSFDNPDSFDFDTNSFKNPYLQKITDPGYFKVKAGDTLKCGLTVTKADWHVDFQSGCGITVQESLVECGGEVTWEGILHRCSEQDVGIEKGDLAFYPDPVKNENIPVICGKYWKSEETGKPEAGITAPLWSEGGLESSGGIIDVGNYFNSEELFGGIFEENNTVRVKITLKNLAFENDETGSRTYAETVNCEIVK